jgi:sterol desaturase/sphingolipid hydroxylase (fatty acid hydroxylase superfamily)
MILEWVQVLKLVALMFLLGALLERIAPAERKQDLRALLFNLAYAPIFLFAAVALVPMLSGITAPLINKLGGLIVVPIPEGFWGSVLYSLAFLLLYDFFYYWWHRAQHELSWLWPQHALHHSERDLNFSTSMRHHWLEEPLRVFVVLLPMGVLFRLEAPTLAWVFTAFSFWGYFIHLNLRLELGVLTAWISGPQYHRIHHSIEPQHHNRNYAAFFPMWDRIFGSACLPEPKQWPRTGIEHGPDHLSVMEALFGPFRAWLRSSGNDARPPR